MPHVPSCFFEVEDRGTVEHPLFFWSSGSQNHPGGTPGGFNLRLSCSSFEVGRWSERVVVVLNQWVEIGGVSRKPRISEMWML